jgi:hypothetical protein
MMYDFCLHSYESSVSRYATTYGCENWSFIHREAHRFRVFENRVLRGIFGPKREEVSGGWRRLHSEELCNFYASPHVISD